MYIVKQNESIFIKIYQINPIFVQISMLGNIAYAMWEICRKVNRNSTRVAVTLYSSVLCGRKQQSSPTLSNGIWFKFGAQILATITCSIVSKSNHSHRSTSSILFYLFRLHPYPEVETWTSPSWKDTKVIMSGGPVYYAQKRVFKKYWHRHVFGAFAVTFCSLVGLYYSKLSYNRYNFFRGRTALYGDEPYNGGKFRNANN